MTAGFFQQAWPDRFAWMQVAFVVDDLIAAAGRWHRLYGAGPFHLMKAGSGEMTYRGETIAPKVRLAVAQMGAVQIELIEQSCDTPSIYTRELNSGGGVHHIASFVHDFDLAIAHYTASGCEVLSTVTLPQMRVAYIDTRSEVGILTEVVEYSDAMQRSLEVIDRTCATWDGKTDPVRILTRDGYRLPA